MAATAKSWQSLLVGALHSYFEESARAAGGTEDHEFLLAGHRVRLRFAGPAWSASLTRGLSHLRLGPAPEGEDPALTVHVWDGAASQPQGLLGFYLHALTLNWIGFLNARGQIVDFHGEPLVALYHPGPDLLSVTDTSSNSAYFWKRDASPVPYYETGSPMRSLLHSWLRQRGCQFVHAAAVGRPQGGVLLAGKGGSGKSTTAVACLNSSLLYAGDDYCLVSTGNRVHSLYNTAKLCGELDLERFPMLKAQVWNQERQPRDKATVFLQDYYPEKLIRDFPLQAILLPHITGQSRTWIEPCKPSEALLALAPTTLAQLPASGSLDMQQMSQVARSVPTFRLHLGSMIKAIPEVIEQFLDRQ